MQITGLSLPDIKIVEQLEHRAGKDAEGKTGAVYLGDYYLAASIPTDDEATALSKDLDPEKSQKAKQTYTPAKWDIDKYMEMM